MSETSDPYRAPPVGVTCGRVVNGKRLSGCGKEAGELRDDELEAAGWSRDPRGTDEILCFECVQKLAAGAQEEWGDYAKPAGLPDGGIFNLGYGGELKAILERLARIEQKIDRLLLPPR